MLSIPIVNKYEISLFGISLIVSFKGGGGGGG